VRIDFGWRKSQFICKMVTGCYYTAQYVAHFRFVVDQPEQRFAPCTVLTYAQDILGGRVQADHQQVFIQQDHAGTQGIENVARIATESSVITGATARQAPSGLI